MPGPRDPAYLRKPTQPIGLKPQQLPVGPVTVEEIERTHDRIRTHMKSRASSFRENFKRYDRDNSGSINYEEAAEMIMRLNLHNVRKECLHEIFACADSDQSGEVDFTEFCTLMMAEDALPMAMHRKRAIMSEGGPWVPQGGRQLSDLAVTMRQSISQQRLNAVAAHDPLVRQSISRGSLTSNAVAGTFVKGAPFDRTMWLERCRLRREEEKLARNQPLLRTFAPRKINNMSYEEGLVAVNFYKEGGQSWKDWSRVHWTPPPVPAHPPRSGSLPFLGTKRPSTSGL